MEIKRSGSHPSGKGPADWFTGTVRVDPLFSPPEPARVSGALVTFEPGARTAWHKLPPGEKHWHGAGVTTAMSHVAIQEKLDGKNVDWMEKVSDEQFGG